MRSIRAASIGVAALLLVLATHCAAPNESVPSDGRFNILLITVDTLRADRLGAYGATSVKTPNMDRLAAQGARFERAYTTVPVTLPAHTSIMTGSYPPYHGVRSNGIFQARDSLVTLAEALKGKGYDTAAVLGSVVLDSAYGLDQGFDLYDDEIGGDSGGQLNLMHAERTAEEVTRRAKQIIAERGEAPFLLWAHYFDPHTVYQAPEPFASDYPGAPYDAEVAYVDDQIGELLAALKREGLESSTLVILTADHGEGLGDHGEAIHGVLLYDATLHVPLILSNPYLIDEPFVSDAAVSVVDIMPTLMETVGVASSTWSYGVQGKSLWPLVRGEQQSLHDLIYFETLLPYFDYGWAALRGARGEQNKLIQGPSPKLFDTLSDPAELYNLYAADSDDVRRLRVPMEQLVETITVEDLAAAELDDDARAQLASLGYVSGAANVTLDEDPFGGPDPEPRIDLVAAINGASFKFMNGQQQAALQELAGIVDRDPENPTVLSLLGILNSELGNLQRSQDYFQRLVEVQPNREQSWGNLGVVYRRLEQVDAAEAAFRRSLEINPNYTDSIYYLALIAMERGEHRKAELGLKRVVELAPDNILARHWLGVQLMRRRSFKSAILQFRQILERNERASDAHSNLATCYLNLRDFDAARTHLKRAKALGARVDPRIEQAINQGS